MTKRFRAVLIAFTLVAVLAACGDDDESSSDSVSAEEGSDDSGDGSEGLEAKTIGVYMSAGQAEVQQRVADAVEQSADALGWEVKIADGEGDPEKMQQRLQALVDSKVDAIVGVFLEPAIVTAQLEAADAAGIPIVNSGFIGSESDVVQAQFIGDQVTMAEMLTETMQEDMPEGGDIGVINLAGYVGVDQRIDTFTEQAPDAGFEIVAVKEVPNADLFGGTTKAGTDILNAEPDLAAFFSCCDFGGQALAPAIEQANKDVPVYSFYAIPSVLDLVRAGAVTVVESDEAKTGAMAIDALAAYFVDGTPLDGDTQLEADPINYTIVTAENVPPAGEDVYPAEEFMAPYLERWKSAYGI